MNLTHCHRTAALCLTAIALAACGGSGGDDPAAGYPVGGTLKGLAAGTSVTLLNNVGDSLALSENGSFSFATLQAANTAYAVTVKTQPDGQICTVSRGNGTATSAVADVEVLCAPGSVQPPIGDPNQQDQALDLSTLTGDWVQNLCAPASPTTTAKSMLRVSRQDGATVSLVLDVLQYANSNCAGTGVPVGATDGGTVVFNATKGIVGLTANYGAWTYITGVSRVVHARKGNLLCVLGDQSPTLFPTAQSVDSYLSLDPRQLQACYTRL
ncbi:MAG: hypothetical protein EOO25_01055 [Comamonadaceae bacterium]|nr:MAG: hypothetical protein EOO25_01055 [Comamonadaceae bacterium]